MVNICLSCSEANSIESKATKFGKVFNNRLNVEAKWAKDFGFVNNAPPIAYKRLKEKKIFNQKKGNMIELNLGKKFANRYIYLWAALPSTDRLKIHHPLKAYNLKTKINDIFGKLNKDGKIKIRIQNPQVYKKKKVYPPHLHYKVSNKEGTDFTKDFFTKTYLGNVEYKFVMEKVKMGCCVIINALPCEYFSKYKIPNSVNLSYKKCKKMKKVDIDKFMKEILINYPKVEKMVKSKKMKLEEIPIIVYCARKSCEAGRILADCLLKNNFVNILDYEGGLKDYYKRKFKKNLF